MAARSTRLFVLFIVLGVLVLECYHNVDAKTRRSGKSSKRVSSTSTNRKSTRRNRRVPPVKAKKGVLPNKPLPVTTFHSSIIKSQVKTVPKTFRQRFVGAAVAGALVYSLLKSPLHSQRYSPYHGSYVVIPKKRALRIKEEEYRVENADGTNCTTGNLTRDDTQNVLNVATKVSYEKNETGIPPIRQQEYTGLKTSNATISPEAIDNYIVNIETRTRFNQSVVNTNGTWENCTVLVTKTKAYLLIMYDTNPNSFAFRNGVDLIMTLVAIIVCARLN